MNGPQQIVLVGPQQPGSDVGAALREREVRGPIALVTAGWQEREAEDAALVAELGGAVTNLRLHARSEQVFAEDRALADALKARQTRLRMVNDFYRVRLDHAVEAARAISVRLADAALLAEERAESVKWLRQLDEDHVERCAEAQRAFDAQWTPTERPSVARHRGELAKILGDAAAVVVVGGHVVSLLNRLKLFDVLALARPDQTWVAAAAGAMVLTERIFLFHDFPPHGTGVAEVHDRGFGLVKDAVVLPDPARRIRRDDREGIARFVQRVAPAACLALDHGARVLVQDGRVVSARCERLLPDGSAQPGIAA